MWEQTNHEQTSGLTNRNRIEGYMRGYFETAYRKEKPQPRPSQEQQLIGKPGVLYIGRYDPRFADHLRLLCRSKNTADPSPVNTRRISSLPSSMPAISTSSVAALVDGPVRPMDRPTVPSEDANSNMQLASGAPSVIHSSRPKQS